MDSINLNDLIALFDFVGIVAFALSGVFEGLRRNVDPVGVFIMSFTTAFGGGTLRDLLIDRRPFYWVDHESYVLAVFIICLFAPAIYRYFQSRKGARFWFLFADALGLGVFCISGTALSLEAGLPMLSSSIIGVITGIFGGLMRDVFLANLPQVVADRQPYAVVAFIGCWVYIALIKCGFNWEASLWFSMIFIVALRMYCIRWGWTISYESSEEGAEDSKLDK